MKIVINNRLTVGHQILDAWHANSQCQTKNYCPNIEYVFDQIDNVAEYDLSIFCDYMPDQMSLDLIKKYDLILICNGGEPIETANPLIKQLLEYSNVYLIANSLLDQRHILHDKVIWFPNHIQLCRDYWTRYFYPQYYANQKFSKLPKNNLLTAVNGSNRSNRRYFFDLLENKISDLPVKSIFTPDELKDCQWETTQDIDFRHWVNNQYQVLKNSENYKKSSMPSMSVGINNKFGLVAIGYFILPEYFENYCIIFPESSWINDELTITEKSLKCFYGGSLPMPVGGANVNKLYNQIGFYTAWNLLPPNHQEFDNESNHKTRYYKLVAAIEWLWNNPKIFESREYEKFVLDNKINFFNCGCERQAVEKFDAIIRKHIAWPTNH